MASLYAHQMTAENYQRFVEAGIADWWEFSHQFKYAKAWADTTEFTPDEAKAWAKAFEGQVNEAAEFKRLNFSLDEASAWYRNTLYSATRCAELRRQGRAPRVVRTRPMRTR